MGLACGDQRPGPGPAQDRVAMRAAGILLVSGGWVGVWTVPYVLSWGPVLLVLLICAVAGVVGRVFGSGRSARGTG
jgi:hypothetical protein